jgi:hypothetical protein
MLVEKKTFGFHVGFFLDEKKIQGDFMMIIKKSFWILCWLKKKIHVGCQKNFLDSMLVEIKNFWIPCWLR